MKRALLARLPLRALGCVLAMTATAAHADNPIVQTIYTPDPAPFVHDGRLYVYTGHDEDDLVGGFFTMNEWRAYSTTDMVNWTDHGSPLRYTDFSWSRGDAWAGQVTERNGKFYYYVPTNIMNGGMVIGVAVSDSPIGPFEDALGQPLITSNCGDIDPTVFIDDDDQAYLYWGNPNLCYVKLNEDMISYEGDVVHVPMTTQSFGVRSNADRPTTYEEGPWFYKREGTYYMVFAAGPISEHIGYATSPSATGPWTYGGVIMPTQGSSFTNHPGVIDFMGNSYFFYHNGALPGGGGFNRSICVERFEYNADGSWPTINMTTQGASAVASLNPYEQIEAETIAWEMGIETGPCSEGGMNVSDIDNGDYIRVEEVDFGQGATSFEARVASAGSGGSIELRLDDADGTLVGTCDVASTGDWQTWETVTCPVSEADANGVHDLYLKFTGAGGPLFNFNWWRFDSPYAPEPDAGVPMAGTGAAGTGAAGTLASAGGAGGIAGTGLATGGTGAVPPAAGTNGTPIPAAGTLGGGGTGVAAGTGAAPMAGATNSGLVRQDDAASGCACRTVPQRENKTPAALALFVVAALTRLRRRRG